MYKVVVVDTETGGLNSDEYSILSLGAVVLEDGVIKDAFYTLVDEGAIKAQPDALKVNGLSLIDIATEGKPPKQVVSDFTDFMTKNGLYKNIQLAGHNIGFDIGFIKRMYKLAGKDYGKTFTWRAVDTMVGAELLRFAGKLKCPTISLNDVCAAYNIVIRTEERHNALEDAKATAILLSKIIQEIRAGSPYPDAI